mgnify:CR=1 FL=1
MRSAAARHLPTLAALALAAGPEWILLDNMPPADMREAVRRAAGWESGLSSLSF